MNRLKLILGVVAVMMAMIAASAVPAMAADNNRHDNRADNRLDNRLDRLDNRFGFDGGSFLVSDVGFSPFFVANSCSPLSFDAINNTIPGCILGDRNGVFDNGFGTVGFVSGINDGRFVDGDFNRGIRFANDNNHIGNGPHDGNNHNGNGNGNGHK